jgi:hypothetical protein
MCGLRILPTAVLITFIASHSFAQNPAITLTPPLVDAGAPTLIYVNASSDATLNGIWQGHTLNFFRASNDRGWFALAGLDVEQAVGPSILQLHMHLAHREIDLSRTIEIHPAHYRTGSLTVAPKFVEPSPGDLVRIKAEQQLKDIVFATSAPEPLWSGSFHAPVTAPPTDSFGTRRTFNGKLASVHKGMDFRARAGTPVKAGNSGVVVLARPLYYEGNCVVIDHGLGLFTLSMHLSRIDVQEGQSVVTGERIGTGPYAGRTPIWTLPSYCGSI